MKGNAVTRSKRVVRTIYRREENRTHTLLGYQTYDVTIACDVDSILDDLALRACRSKRHRATAQGSRIILLAKPIGPMRPADREETIK